MGLEQGDGVAEGMGGGEDAVLVVEAVGEPFAEAGGGQGEGLVGAGAGGDGGPGVAELGGEGGGEAHGVVEDLFGEADGAGHICPSISIIGGWGASVSL